MRRTTGGNQDGRPPARRTDPPALRDWRRLALAAAMLAVMVAELLVLFLAWPRAHSAAHAALLAFLLLALPLVRLREGYLLGVAAMLSALALAIDPAPAEAFGRAFDQAAFLITFILAIGLLREGAATSPAVLACGLYMTRQPAGRRYIAVQLGGNFIGALINLGALSLLAPLIQRGIREDGGKGAAHWVVARTRERRQLTALLRGFAWQLVWSPATVTLAIVPTLIPGVRLGELVGAGLVLSAIMLALGWLEDRIRFARLRRLLARRGWLPEPDRARLPVRALLGLAAVCASLVALTAFWRWLASVGIIPALLLAAPVVLAAWLAVQNAPLGTAGALAATASRLGRIAAHAIPRAAPEAMTLAASGYIGVVASRLVPLDAMADALKLAAWPQWLFLLCIPLTMLLLGQIGPSPVMMVILLGTLIGALPQLPADATLTGIALVSGGALATTASPFASGVLVLSRITGHATTTLSWRWNLPFAAAAIAVLAVLFLVLTGGR